MSEETKLLTIADKVRIVNAILEKGEADGNFSTDHKGYTGYKPQCVIDAVNQEFMGEWSIEVLEHKTYPTQGKNGTINNAFVKVRVTFCGLEMDSFASHPIVADPGDAFKSAQTDAMKKAFSLFSIGTRAYQGKLGQQ